MTNTYKMLGQLRPSGTSAVSIYSPPDNTQVIIKSIVICNSNGAGVHASVFVDNTGTTYNETTALVWGADISHGAMPTILNCDICLNNTAGNIAVKTDTANALTFTIFGLEIK